MKTLVVIPWEADEFILEHERGTLPDDVDVQGLENGEPLYGYSNIVRNTSLFLDAVKQAQRDGYDAVISACFADTGVEVARKLVDIPVLGCLRVGLHVAGMLGNKICVLMPDMSRYGGNTRHIVESYGFGHMAVVRGSDLGGMDIVISRLQYLQNGGEIPAPVGELVDVIIKSAVEDGADVVLLGSGALQGMEQMLTDELTKRDYDIPVVNPMTAAVEIAKGLGVLKLSHGHIGYPKED